ncbi:adenosylhomocysteinase [Streptosporangium sp. NPDC005286]|uniref:adenosylhomocysteinase n=1 Tax=Streptosporangium sp. NPDC005286 TaxID=3154463 RepID=UPI0033B769E4
MESFEKARLDAFFRRVTERFPDPEPVSSVIITHLLAERPAFLHAMARLTRVAAVLPKPRSIFESAAAEARKHFTLDPLSRTRFADPASALNYLEETAAGQDLLLLDIGGYFAASLEVACAQFSGRIRGVVEDTENGLQRYLALEKLPCPVYSVARSPLKEPEDHLVGHSIVFSTEALIRSRGDILGSLDACVIGYGKLGGSIARMLHAKNVRVTVYDDDPVKRVQARSHGFHVPVTRAEAIRGCGLIVCATGNLALRHEDFTALPNGAYIASVTSSEDELELTALTPLYRRAEVGPHVTRYSTTGHYFYVLADGNAVNFLHGATVGPYIHLVQAEILAVTALLTSDDHAPGLHELTIDARQVIAEIWLDYFKR